MAETNTLLVMIALGGPVVAGVASFLAARVNSKPAADAALTVRFEAFIRHQDEERARLIAEHDAKMRKLEAVTSDLETIVIKFMEWADEVIIVTQRRGVKIPDRPKFSHMTGIS